ncbi:MAG: EAL domain-containing protein [Gammaproteobacteria bacterium]|nr:EAL domain-containing protein [Gammaproteobacteria bacterium]
MEQALAASGLSPACLCLEITETTLMQRASTSLETLVRLDAIGVSLAIDDFGTGYSSLAYLHKFPVRTLKLDKAMIEGLPGDESTRAIVIAVREMAAALKLRVVVEGIEHRAQAEELQQLGFRHVQGFYYARPEPADAFAQRLRADVAAVGSGRPVVADRAGRPR